jgi:hypothetical protein
MGPAQLTRGAAAYFSSLQGQHQHDVLVSFGFTNGQGAAQTRCGQLETTGNPGLTLQAHQA